MLSNLFVNACILIAIIFVTTEFLESSKARKYSKNIKNIISGTSFGISSILLMKYSIFVTPTAFLDFRIISQASSAFYGGPVPSIITGFISATYHLFYLEIDLNSIMIFISMIVSSLSCAYISRSKLDNNLKWLLMIISTNLIHSVLFFLILDNLSDIIKVISALIIGSMLVSTIVYYLFNYLSLSRKQIQILQQQACMDFLTGVHNKRNFDCLYNEEIRKIKNKSDVFSVLMLDIDYFKNINDTYGHLAGDRVLKDLGHILSRFSKKNEIVGRIGGEEFCILLRGYSRSEAVEFAENLRSYIKETKFIISSQKQIYITVSIGISSNEDGNLDIDNIREIADQNLYRCKKSGRNKVCS